MIRQRMGGVQTCVASGCEATTEPGAVWAAVREPRLAWTGRQWLFALADVEGGVRGGVGAKLAAA